jgi:uncharacterized caspase-like protein
VGIEHYASLPAPTGASSDARNIAELFTTSLGIPQTHVHLLVDERATKATVERELEWLKATSTGGGRVYFYFSGHGAPDPSTGTSYLVPYDGDPKFLNATGLRVTDVIAQLGQTKAHDVLAMLDSCFSGAGGRSVLPPGSRPLVRVVDTTPNDAAAPQVAVLSAATGAEISGPSSDNQSGLFTKYLVDGLGKAAADADGDGQISLQELYDWVAPRVTREAKESANREQTPSMTVGAGVGNASSVIIAWGLAKH